MKLKNLITIADENTTFILNGIMEDGTEISYDFGSNKWAEDSLFKPSRVGTIGDFSRSKFYRSIRENIIEDFSVFKGGNIKEFEGVKLYRGNILKIKIFIFSNKTSIRKAIDARVKMIAEKRASTMAPPRKQTYRRKKNYSNLHRIPGAELPENDS